MEDNAYKEALKKRLQGASVNPAIAASQSRRQAGATTKSNKNQLKSVANQQLDALRAVDYSNYRGK